VTESGHVLHCGRSRSAELDLGDAGLHKSAGRSDGFLAKLAPL
jgi:hypothetical protein